MADCVGQVLQIAVMEDGSASVNIPVENWRDVKSVRGLGAAEGVQILQADDQIRVYHGPSGMMLDVCVEFLSDDEKAARDKQRADEAHDAVAAVHDSQVEAAAAEVQAAKDYKADVEPNAEDEALAEAERGVKEAEAALERAKQARDQAHAEVDRG